MVWCRPKWPQQHQAMPNNIFTRLSFFYSLPNKNIKRFVWARHSSTLLILLNYLDFSKLMSWWRLRLILFKAPPSSKISPISFLSLSSLSLSFSLSQPSLTLCFLSFVTLLRSLSVSLSVCLYLSNYLSIYKSIYLLSFVLSIFSFTYQLFSMYLSIYLTLFFSPLPAPSFATRTSSLYRV